jgi:hypothetical protein
MLTRLPVPFGLGSNSSERRDDLDVFARESPMEYRTVGLTVRSNLKPVSVPSCRQFFDGRIQDRTSYRYYAKIPAIPSASRKVASFRA